MDNRERDFLDTLKRVDYVEIIKQINIFKSLNIESMDVEQINAAIHNVLFFENQFNYLTNMQDYHKGTLFFRARKLNLSVLSEMHEHEFWNAPRSLIKTHGRLNKPYESLLYTTPLFPEITLREIKIPDDSFYMIMVYEGIKEIKVNFIGEEYHYEELGITDVKVKLINDSYNNFLKNEFRRDVSEGKEYLYRVSERIAKLPWFDLPRDKQDAWGYPSLKDKKKYNVCFRPEVAKEVLRLKGSLICKKNPKSYDINIIKIQSGFDSSGKALCHSIGSEEQMKVFPQIRF